MQVPSTRPGLVPIIEGQFHEVQEIQSEERKVVHPRLQRLAPQAFFWPQGAWKAEIEKRREPLNTQTLSWPVLEGGRSAEAVFFLWTPQEFFHYISDYLKTRFSAEVEPFYSGGKAIILACGQERYAKACDTDLQFFITGLLPFRIGEIEQAVRSYVRMKLACALGVSTEDVQEEWVFSYLPPPVYVVSREASLSIVTFKVQEHDLVFTLQAHRMHTFRGKSLLVSMLGDPLLLTLEGSVEEVLEDVRVGRIETQSPQELLGKGPLNFWELKIQGWSACSATLQREMVGSLVRLLSSEKGKIYLEEYLADHRKDDLSAQISFLLTGYLDLAWSEHEKNGPYKMAQRVLYEALEISIQRGRQQVDRSEEFEALLQLAEGALHQQPVWHLFTAMALLYPEKVLKQMPEGREGTEETRGVFRNGQDLFILLPRQHDLERRFRDRCYLVLPHLRAKVWDILLENDLVENLSKMPVLEALPHVQEAFAEENWEVFFFQMTGIQVPRKLFFSWLLPPPVSIGDYLYSVRTSLAAGKRVFGEGCEALAWKLTTLEVLLATSEKTYEVLIKLIGRVVLLKGGEGAHQLEYARRLMEIMRPYETFSLLDGWKESKASFLKAYYLYLQDHPSLIRGHFRWLVQNKGALEDAIFSELFALLFDEEDLFSMLWSLRPDGENDLWQSCQSLEQLAAFGKYLPFEEMTQPSLQLFTEKVLVAITPLTQIQMRGSSEFLISLLEKVFQRFHEGDLLKCLYLQISFLLDLKSRKNLLSLMAVSYPTEEKQSALWVHDLASFLQGLGKKRPSENIMQFVVHLSQELPATVATLQGAGLGNWLSVLLYREEIAVLIQVIDAVVHQGQDSSLKVVEKLIRWALQGDDKKRGDAFFLWKEMSTRARERYLATFLSWAEEQQVLQAPWPIVLQMMDFSLPDEKKRWLRLLQAVDGLNTEQFLQLAHGLWEYKGSCLLSHQFSRQLTYFIVSQESHVPLEWIRWVLFLSKSLEHTQEMISCCRHILRVDQPMSADKSLAMIQTLAALQGQQGLSWSDWTEQELSAVLDLWQKVQIQEVSKETGMLLAISGEEERAASPALEKLTIRCKELGARWTQDLIKRKPPGWQEAFFKVEAKALFEEDDRAFFLVACILEHAKISGFNRPVGTAKWAIEAFYKTLDALDPMIAFHDVLFPLCYGLAELGNRDRDALEDLIGDRELHFEYVKVGYTLLSHPELQELLMASLPGKVMAYFYISYARHQPEAVDAIHQKIVFFQQTQGMLLQIQELMACWTIECSLRYRELFVGMVLEGAITFSSPYWKQKCPATLYAITWGWLTLAQHIHKKPLDEARGRQILATLQECSHATEMFVSWSRAEGSTLAQQVLDYATQLAALGAMACTAFPADGVRSIRNWKARREVLIYEVVAWLLSFQDGYYATWSISLLEAGAIDLINLPIAKSQPVIQALIETFYLSASPTTPKSNLKNSLHCMGYLKTLLRVYRPERLSELFSPFRQQIFAALRLHIVWSGKVDVQVNDLASLMDLFSLLALVNVSSPLESLWTQIDALVEDALLLVSHNPILWALASGLLQKGMQILRYAEGERGALEARVCDLVIRVGKLSEGAIEGYLQGTVWHRSEAFVEACVLWADACSHLIEIFGEKVLTSSLLGVIQDSFFGLERRVQTDFNWKSGTTVLCLHLMGTYMPHAPEKNHDSLLALARRIFDNFDKVVMHIRRNMSKKEGDCYISDRVLPSFESFISVFLDFVTNQKSGLLESMNTIMAFQNVIKRSLDTRLAEIWRDRLQKRIEYKGPKPNETVVIIRNEKKK